MKTNRDTIGTIDTSLHALAGFTIISREEGEARKRAMDEYRKTKKEVWPVEDVAFNPRGVTLEEARKAMELL